MKEGKMNPATRMILPEPGMPGQPMYYVIPKKTAHPDIAKNILNLRQPRKCREKRLLNALTGIPELTAHILREWCLMKSIKGF
jgi:hypothetical protein